MTAAGIGSPEAVTSLRKLLDARHFDEPFACSLDAIRLASRNFTPNRAVAVIPFHGDNANFPTIRRLRRSVDGSKSVNA